METHLRKARWVIEIARLEIVLNALNARQQVAALKADLLSLGTAANTGGNQATQGINKIGTQAKRAATQTQSAATDMERALSRVGTAFVGAFTVDRMARFLSESVKVNMEFRRMDNVITGLTGSAAAAQEQLAFLTKESDRLGLNFRSTVQAFVRFEAAAKGSTIGEGTLRDIFVSTAEAARKFGLTTSEQERIFLAYEQMVSKGVVSMEELRRQLGDSLPGAFAIGARAMGLTTVEFMKLVESGKLLSQEFLPKFAKQLKNDVTGAVDDLAISLGQLQNAWDRFKNSIGQGIRPAVQGAARGATVALDALTPNTPDQAEVQRVAREIAASRVGTTGLRGRPLQEWEINRAISEMMLTKPELFEEAAQKIQGQRTDYKKFTEDFGLPKEFTTPDTTPARVMDSQQTAKFEREINQQTLQRLEGRQKIVETYRQEEQAIIDLGLPLDKEAQLVGLIRQNMSQALSDDMFGNMAENAKRMGEEMEKLDKTAKELFFETLDPGEQSAAKINAEFEKDVMTLIELTEVGREAGLTYDDLVYKRDRALAQGAKTRRGGQSRDRVVDFASMTESWGTFEQRVGEGGAALADSLDQNFSDAFTSMIMGTKSVGDAFSQMATSIVSDLVRIMVQQMVVRSVMQVAGGLGGVTEAGAVANIRSNYHVGGEVGFGATRARRFHDGGGVMGDEMPVIARRGEVIFTPEQMGALGKVIAQNQGKSQQKVEVVNVMDPSLFTDNLYRNKDAILNIIGRESKTVRRMIG